MKYHPLKFIFLIFSVFVLLLPNWAEAHIKWFVEFDVSDPPQTLAVIQSKIYYIYLFGLSLLGVIVALLLDNIWFKKFGRFTLVDDIFSHHKDIALNIARIGTGVFFVAIWLVGNVILTPELGTDAEYIPFIQLGIAISVLFKRCLWIAGLGILSLYTIATYEYGLFHLLDYVTFIGLAFYLILSSFKTERFDAYRLPILYYSLIFSFLWSAIEKIAYPQWFYSFLQKYELFTFGLDVDLFIACTAFVEFMLFFLLLIGKNGAIVLALLINILIISGNIYFGKMDTIGHFSSNFILVIMLIRGALPINISCFEKHGKIAPAIFKGVLIYFAVFGFLFFTYYGIHTLMY
jgi:hypothetical protein